ncbi:unnamed protein product, partial [marine sediment metagenome]
MSMVHPTEYPPFLLSGTCKNDPKTCPFYLT